MTHADPIDVDPAENEVEHLVWALVDEMITPEETQRLEQLMTEDDTARTCYIQCMQMHADLHQIFSVEKSEQTPDIAGSVVVNAPSSEMPIVFDALPNMLGDGMIEN